jgi:hypothetical protein
VAEVEGKKALLRLCDLDPANECRLRVYNGQLFTS